jgi:hypothetical protein
VQGMVLLDALVQIDAVTEQVLLVSCCTIMIELAKKIRAHSSQFQMDDLGNSSTKIEL